MLQHRDGPAATGVPWRSRLSEHKSIFVVSDRAGRRYGRRRKKIENTKNAFRPRIDGSVEK